MPVMGSRPRMVLAINGNVTITTDERSIIGNVTNSAFTVT